MSKRIYVRPEDDCPKPLKSNWPNLGEPVENPEFIKEARVEVASKFLVKHEYILYKGDRKIQSCKTLQEAEGIKKLLRKERPRVWIYKHEPTPEQAWEQRQQEKAEWRWQAGFGA